MTRIAAASGNRAQLVLCPPLCSPMQRGLGVDITGQRAAVHHSRALLRVHKHAAAGQVEGRM